MVDDLDEIRARLEETERRLAETQRKVERLMLLVNGAASVLRDHGDHSVATVLEAAADEIGAAG